MVVLGAQRPGDLATIDILSDARQGSRLREEQNRDSAISIVTQLLHDPSVTGVPGL